MIMMGKSIRQIWVNGRSSLSNENDHRYFLNMVDVCLMADYANSSSKLSVASRASRCHGMNLPGDPLAMALRSLRFFQLHRFSFLHRELLC